MLKVEINQYREINKGSLKASFSFVLKPDDQEIRDCAYFVQGENRWINFPQKEIKYSDGRKTTYMPLIKYLNKEKEDQIKNEVLKELKSKESNVQKDNSSISREKSSLQAEPSFGWDKPPF